MKLKALSLAQPYANLVACGQKTLETRVWGTSYRGDILICASMSGVGEPHGVALCVVELVHIRPMTVADELAACIALYPRAKVWELANLRPVRQIPIKGQLSLYDVVVPDDLFDIA